MVNVPSRGASFTAIVREVEIEIADPADDRSFYTIGFANDLASPLGIEYAGQCHRDRAAGYASTAANDASGCLLPGQPDGGADHHRDIRRPWRWTPISASQRDRH